jgi:hypothetical protein
VFLGRWIKRKDNCERIERIRDIGNDKLWEEVAVFNNRYHMTRDNQSHGSGTIGTTGGGFLSISESPKAFGLYLLTPFGDLSFAKYLARYRSKIALNVLEDGKVKIEGPFPVDDPNGRLVIEVDRSFGYRPTKIDFFDGEGIYSKFVVSEYRSFGLGDTVVWLPNKGAWYGFDPELRTPSTLMTFSATSIDVNSLPTDDSFVLTYPQGALLLNTDTGESFYASRDTNFEDVPMFANAKISLSEHYAKLTSERLETPSKTRASVIVFLVAIVLFSLWFVRRVQFNRESGN